MTVIAAIKQNDIVYLGCDSLFMDSYKITTRVGKKIIVKGELIFGITTTHTRIYQLLEHSLKLASTKNVKTDDLHGYLVTSFLPKFRKILDVQDLLQDDKEAPSPSPMLIGVRNKLFELDVDFDISEIDTSYKAIGMGGDYASGSLITSEILQPTLPAEQRLLLALQTSGEFSCGVKGPFYIINTKDYTFVKN